MDFPLYLLFQSILYPMQIKIPKYIFIFILHFKGVFTRVKNYVPWITKYAADGACRKPNKQERGGKLESRIGRPGRRRMKLWQKAKKRRERNKRKKIKI